MILVDDGSPADTWAAIQELARRRPQVRGIRLGRIFGQHNALVAGVRAARFPLTVTIDDDLQNPPEEIPRLVAALHDQGLDVIYGVPLRIPSGAFFSPQTVINDSDTAIIKSRVRQHQDPERLQRVDPRGDQRQGNERRNEQQEGVPAGPPDHTNQGHPSLPHALLTLPTIGRTWQVSAPTWPTDDRLETIVGRVAVTQAAQRAVAIIPARGGSKRIPRKNIRMMSGRPLIAWAVQAAIASEQFADVVVSTDDEEIAEIASGCGASVPFLRPIDLADDFASTASVMAHAVAELRDHGFGGDLACCIYPAAIFVEPEDYSRARDLLKASDRPYASTVVRYQHPIQRALDLDGSGHLSLVDPASAGQRTQDLPTRWHDAGQFYWGRVDAWLAQTPILANSVGYELPPTRAVDIDTEEDWLQAERLHAAQRSR